MAVANNRAPKRTPEKKPAAAPAKRRAPAKKAQHTGLTSAQRDFLASLDAGYEDSADRPMADIFREAADLLAIMRRLGATLYAKSSLDKVVGDSLATRIALLEAAEAEWYERRTAPLPEDGKSQLDEAEELKKDAIAALREFCKDRQDVQNKLDDIIPGTGIDDLIDDLKKLGPLLNDNAAALKKADLPKNASSRAIALAKALSAGSTERTVGKRIDRAGDASLSMRNRAYWWLREAMDAIRSSGRYAFRKQPELLPLFQATSTRAKKKAARRASAQATRAAKKATTAGAPAPGTTPDAPAPDAPAPGDARPAAASRRAR